MACLGVDPFGSGRLSLAERKRSRFVVNYFSQALVVVSRTCQRAFFLGMFLFPKDGHRTGSPSSRSEEMLDRSAGHWTIEVVWSVDRVLVIFPTSFVATQYT